MSDKVRIRMYKNTSKAGNNYLSGKDKATGVRYYLFNDNKDPSKKRLAIKKDPTGDLRNVATLDTKTYERDGVEETFYADQVYAVWTNPYYYEDDSDAAKGGVRFASTKDGEPILNASGEPIEKNTHSLVIGS